MKLIFGKKTVEILPKFDFSGDLSLSTFLKHYSNIAVFIHLSEKLHSIDGFQCLHISNSLKRIFDVINKIWRQEDVEQWAGKILLFRLLYP